MYPTIDMTGATIGRGTVISQSATKRKGDTGAFWNILCSCGKSYIARGVELRRGSVRSCGCLSNESKSRLHLKHGHAQNGASATYVSWQSMRARCFNKNRNVYPNYGGRGITVCGRWNDFQNFLSDMGERPDGTSLDRINNSLGYCPENCRWSTRGEQLKNRRERKVLEKWTDGELISELKRRGHNVPA